MKRKSYYRKGASVIYHYSERRKVMWTASGYGWVDTWKRARLVEHPRDEYGRFTSNEDDMEYMKLKDEQGNIIITNINKVEPDRRVTDLSREELVKLWEQIKGGSVFYADYRNSLGVFENTAAVFYEGFWEHLVSECEDESEAEQEDTAENFADYVMYWCEDIA